MNPRRIVVAGTGTEVGKTRFVVELQSRLRAAGHRTLALKPVETGYVADSAATSDATRIAINNPLSPPPLYPLSQPLSPHLAAELDDRVIDIGAVLPWAERFEKLHYAAEQVPLEARASSAHSEQPPITFIELAGGLFTPLTLTQVNLDLVRLLEPCRFLLVANDRLGVLHDVLVCTRAAEVFHRLPDLVVFSQHSVDHSTASNRTQFERLMPGVPTCCLGPSLELDLDLSWFQR